MKIVHSFWSKPALSKTGNLEKFNGGWRHPKYHLMSWALSCLSFKKHYGEIELVTDATGKQLLIDQLELPYSSVKVELDVLNDYPEYLWAIGKIYSHTLHKEPFLHVDGDAYIWEKFEDLEESANLIGHHLDEGSTAQNYHKAMNHLEDLKVVLPDYLLNDFKNKTVLSVSSAGMIGGSDLEFYRYYAKEAFGLIDSNLSIGSKNLMDDLYALVYEQYLFSVLAGIKNLEITHVFSKTNMASLDMINFMNKNGKDKYVHLFSKAKKCLEYCHMLEHVLLLEYPDYHTRIKKLMG